MAAVMGLGKDLVRQVWREADLKPHRLERYMASNDPHFEEKATDIIGLHLNPPQHAAVFPVDEKSAIQALDRRDRRLPLSPGRAERHGFEYHRHGSLSLYAALNPQTGQVLGQTAPRHSSAEFVSFLGEVVASQPANREIHIIVDNFSAHKTTLVKEFLAGHPNVQLHFTPTYTSWLNQVEIGSPSWSAKSSHVGSSLRSPTFLLHWPHLAVPRFGLELFNRPASSKTNRHRPTMRANVRMADHTTG